MLTKERGFTLTELVAVLSFLCILLFCACQGGRTAADRTRDGETMANLHTIQTALERYATDHSGEYPAYLLGGDWKGWDLQSGCAVVTGTEIEDERPLRDPLIHHGYVYSYPDNPFIDPGDGLEKVIAETSSTSEVGYGDVRFGWFGELMGNCLDDPRYLFDGYGVPSRLQYTMVRDDQAGIGVLSEGRQNSFYCMGGLPDGKSYWPGQFFYRSGGDFSIADNPSSISGEEYEVIWGWPYMRINKYILGGFGSPRTEGMDVIRLTTKEGLEAARQPGAISGAIDGQYYQDNDDPCRAASHPDFNLLIRYSNPEVMGGGEQGLMPQFPYYKPSTGAWMFGAPDGYADGVILVITSQGGRQSAFYWQNGGVEERPL